MVLLDIALLLFQELHGACSFPCISVGISAVWTVGLMAMHKDPSDHRSPPPLPVALMAVRRRRTGSMWWRTSSPTTSQGEEGKRRDQRCTGPHLRSR
ncbi:MAG: hypothetical protein M0C28_31500 [Candidatus Moduliflexus flocculans]|nr:hypothetical protein [Candidatus Moduliflexus flocculans]